MPRVPASLRALLAHLIDYAGLYPPAALPLEIVVERYRGFRASPESWILNRLVLPASRLAEARLDVAWPVTLLADDDPRPLPPQVETIETKNPDLGVPIATYVEAPLASVHRHFAKVRTGGLTPDAIPSSADLARFLTDAAARRLPFKATAGLHHPIRSVRPLTYAVDSPRAPMHGFLNVFTAAALAWHGAGDHAVVDLLEERDFAAFRFDDDALTWRAHCLSTEELAASRRDFAHSFGSCSFEEPVTELRELGLLP
jgi:hypothetical protein